VVEVTALGGVVAAGNEPLLLTTDEAATRLRISKSALYDLIRSRRLQTVKIGARRLVPVEALPAAIALLIEETES
jgi:excisionase family DNA binding protein